VKPLVLCLGNDLLTDDGVGIEAAHRIQWTMGDRVDVVATSVSGLALLEQLSGHSRVILIDAIQTGQDPVGSIRRLRLDELASVSAPSPHYAGLPEMLEIARLTSIPFPDDLVILAIEIEDAVTIGGRLTPWVARAVDDIVAQVDRQVRTWQEEETHA
jgi:hydrogenase maturation protease